jgi:hypothetical protein
MVKTGTAVGIFSTAVASIPAIAWTANQIGFGPTDEERRVLENPEAPYFNVTQKLINEIYNDKFGPVNSDQPKELAFPDVSTFLKNKKLVRRNPTEYNWEMPFNLLGYDADTQPVPMNIVVIVNDENAQYPTQETIRTVRVKGNLQAFFSTLESHNARLQALAALGHRLNEYPIIKDITETNKPSAKSLGVSENNFKPPTTEASNETNGRFIDTVTLNEQGDYIFSRSYNS